MRLSIAVAVLVFVSAPVLAQAPKPCEELKAEIAKKLDAKGVQPFSLEVVAKDKEAAEAKVVGTCDGGTKKIVYRRTSVPQEKPAAETKK